MSQGEIIEILKSICPDKMTTKQLAKKLDLNRNTVQGNLRKLRKHCPNGFKWAVIKNSSGGKLYIYWWDDGRNDARD